MSVFIIAEVGSTHDGSFGNAMRAVDAAADAGVDAVKFQTHIADAETLTDAPMPPYFKGEPRFEYFTRTGFSSDQWSELMASSKEKGIEFLSSPFFPVSYFSFASIYILIHSKTVIMYFISRSHFSILMPLNIFTSQ